MKSSKIFDILEKYSQSNKTLFNVGQIDMFVCLTENIRGGGKNSAPRTINKISKLKHSVVTINNDDDSCAFRALFVALYHQNNNNGLVLNNWMQVRYDRCSVQTNGAKEIAKKCGFKLNTAVGHEDWGKIQTFFPDLQINVVDAVMKHNFIYRGPFRDKRVYIEYINNHYNAITNIRGYMSAKYYCEKCNVKYRELFKHRCPDQCTQCYSNCGQEDIRITCDQFERQFINRYCYTNHLGRLCAKIKYCIKCGVTYKTSEKHKCNFFKCKKCGVCTDKPHYCDIKPANKNALMEDDDINKIIV